jgi:hypothetical protein
MIASIGTDGTLLTGGVEIPQSFKSARALLRPEETASLTGRIVRTG